MVPSCAVNAAPERPATMIRGEKRRELAAHREAHPVDDEDVGPVALRLHAEKIGKDDADEEIDQRDDRQRVEAHRLELRHGLAQPEALGKAHERERLEHHRAQERVVRAQSPASATDRRADARHEAECSGMALGRRALHALVHEARSRRWRASKPRVLTIASVQPQVRQGCEQRKARRGVELAQPAAVDDVVLLQAQAEPGERARDRLQVRETPHPVR
jgi:hypothetical protein